MRPLRICLLALALFGALTACSDDTDPNTVPATQDAGTDDTDTADAVDVSDDAVADIGSVDTTETPCGPNLTCTSGEVCIEICECCGVFNGEDFSDFRSSYLCAPPDPDCEGRPFECVDHEAFTPEDPTNRCSGDYYCVVGCA